MFIQSVNVNITPKTTTTQIKHPSDMRIDDQWCDFTNRRAQHPERQSIIGKIIEGHRSVMPQNNAKCQQKKSLLIIWSSAQSLRRMGPLVCVCVHVYHLSVCISSVWRLNFYIHLDTACLSLPGTCKFMFSSFFTARESEREREMRFHIIFG